MMLSRPSPASRPVGDLLREWRQRRRLSQLDLAGDAEISTRHLSCVETDPALAAARKAVDLVLAGHEPYPAIAVDRHWTLVASNAAVPALLAGADAALLQPPVNVLRLS